MSIAKNQQAIDATRNKNLWAIFITSMGQRYAVRSGNCMDKTYRETNGKWERCENLANFLVWNADLQGFDDISTLIEE